MKQLVAPSFVRHFLVLAFLTLTLLVSFFFGHSYGLLCSSYAHHLKADVLQSLVLGPFLLSTDILSLDDLTYYPDFEWLLC